MNEQNDSSVVVALGAKATIEQVSSLADEIRAKLKQTDMLLFQVDQVEQIDLSVIQLMYATKRQADKEGKTFQFTGTASQAFLDTLVDAGFLNEPVDDLSVLHRSLIDFD
ncbi:STAS domain-containing protein [Sediminispirochaeta smaragdinae]|uniref:CheA signal transduction histidine kinase n=1 Tax=Sediminispirochaeta smaragdinae (strain DSM 11293 / JCM 15392 / SEBR 4228) TaxID=573413 RepID=E1R6C8_SEDSS|nr:STAS domain-containing protein [Sediminispirochaeta smaragdinae]ADK80946.1 CheA signal transduction histidine kinase [Sediminispirochaeta smaragdinae DSM 11293]